MSLKVIVGKADTMMDALAMALGKFNEETDERREFKSSQHQIIMEATEDGTDFKDQHYFFICYIAHEIKQQEPDYKYIGSTEINPQDPDWLTKWQEQQNEKIGPYFPEPSLIQPIRIEDVLEDWNDGVIDTPESLPNGSQNTES